MSDLPPGHAVQVFPDAGALFDGAAAFVTGELSGLAGGARLVFPGGSTPGALYDLLARARTGPAWGSFRYFTSDERCVPPDHADSNARLLGSRLLDPLGVAPDRFLRFHGEDPPERGAEKLHRELVDYAQRVPLFDRVLLGLGEDGHTASLFPAATWPGIGSRWAAAVRHPDGSSRLTLTPAALRSTSATWFLVSGASKAEAVARTLTAPAASPETPARMAAGPRTVWLLDRAAAVGLPAAWSRPR